KTAHDELRALIRSVRDAHDEWSSPLNQCAFTPDGSHSCSEEQRRQYQRLFLNANEKKDAARIMASVFRAPINSAVKTAPAALVPQQAKARQFEGRDGDPSADSRRKLKLARKSFDALE